MVKEEKQAEENGSKQDWVKVVAFALGELLVLVVLIGMILYLVAQYAKDSFNPFEMATVVALVGGFIFVAAFGSNVDAKLRPRLKAIGGLYLLSTIALIVFGFYQAADQAKLAPKGGLTGDWITTFYVATFYIGAILFCIALIGTLVAIPNILGVHSFEDLSKIMFGKKPKKKK